MSNHKFDVSKLEKLNHPGRLVEINPEHIWEFIGVKNAKTIADIGAGTGLFAKAFSQLSPNSKIIALDLSPIMIDWMNAHICPEFPNITTLLMTESETPLAEQSVDVAMMINLHHELKDEMAMLQECYRILKAGGKIAISDWKKTETPKGPPMEIRSEPEEIVAQLLKSGFVNPRIFNSLINNWLVVAEK